MGLRYRVDYPADTGDRRRRVDIVFTRARVAVFIDGCFWHGCPTHFVEPKNNADYWRPKIQRNRERDLESTARLESAGWTVLRFWEHEDPGGAAELIRATVLSAPSNSVQRRPDAEGRVASRSPVPLATPERHVSSDPTGFRYDGSTP